MFFQLTCIEIWCKINLALLEALVQVELAELGEAQNGTRVPFYPTSHNAPSRIASKALQSRS